MPSLANIAATPHYATAMSTQNEAAQSRDINTSQLVKPLNITAYWHWQNRNSGKTHEQQAANTERQALALFTKYRDNPDGLLQVLKTMGVAIYDGRQDPWVNDYLNTQRCVGMTIVPDSVCHPDEYYCEGKRKIHNPKTPLEQSQAQREDNLDEHQQIGLFLTSPTANVKDYKDTIFHETFHILQYLNGQRSCKEMDAGDLAFEALQNSIRHWFSSIRSNLVYGFQALWFDVKRLVFLKPKPTALSENIQQTSRYELDTYNFLSKHGQELHLPKQATQANKNTAFIYKELDKYAPEIAKQYDT